MNGLVRKQWLRYASKVTLLGGVTLEGMLLRWHFWPSCDMRISWRWRKSHWEEMSRASFLLWSFVNRLGFFVISTCLWIELWPIHPLSIEVHVKLKPTHLVKHDMEKHEIDYLSPLYYFFPHRPIIQHFISRLLRIEPCMKPRSYTIRDLRFVMITQYYTVTEFFSGPDVDHAALRGSLRRVTGTVDNWFHHELISFFPSGQMSNEAVVDGAWVPPSALCHTSRSQGTVAYCNRFPIVTRNLPFLTLPHSSVTSSYGDDNSCTYTLIYHPY